MFRVLGSSLKEKAPRCSVFKHLDPELVSLLEEGEETLEASTGSMSVGKGFECSLSDLSSAHYLLHNCCWDVSSYLLGLVPSLPTAKLPCHNGLLSL